MSHRVVRPRTWTPASAAFAFLINISGFALEQAPSPLPNPSPERIANVGSHDLTAIDLQSFLDGLMSQTLPTPARFSGAPTSLFKQTRR
jgi:hypothetical protein